MFKIEDQETIEWPVVVNVPQNGGTFKKERFTVEFMMISDSEILSIHEGGGRDPEVLRKVVVGWGDDVFDRDGKPLPFTRESLELLINIRRNRDALISAYGEISKGEAARKN